MTVLIVSVAVVLIVSAFCSLTEAAIYAVRLPFIGTLVEAGSTAGKRLAKFKHNMEQPISAILIVNTAANTAGAAVAGAQARQLFGDTSLIWFSAAFTIAVLFLAEIMPKVAGVAYNRTIAPMASAPLSFLIKLLYPVIWLTQNVARLLQRDEAVRIAPEEEVVQFAAMSAKEGSILKFESDLVKNALGLDSLRAKDILSPRTVVAKLSSDKTVQEVGDEVARMSHARIPVYASDQPEDWNGFVLRGDILAALARDEFDTTLASLAKPLHFVPQTAPCHELLNDLIRDRYHIKGVIDEFGVVVGIVTLEDVVESLIGQEIVDETDRDVDMQEVARRQAREALNPTGGTDSESKGDQGGPSPSA